MCTNMTLTQSKVKVKVTRVFEVLKTALCLGLSPFWRAQKWRFIMIIRDPVCSLSRPNFWISLSESYHVSSNFSECRYYRNFKGPYFRIAGSYGHMFGYASSAICIVHADMTLTRSKVKVMGLLKFRRLHCIFLGLSPLPFWRRAQNWRLIMIAWDLVYSLSEPDFWIFFSESYHTNFKGPYIRTARG